MLFAELSDQAVSIITSGVVTVAMAIVGGMFGYLTKRLNNLDNKADLAVKSASDANEAMDDHATSVKNSLTISNREQNKKLDALVVTSNMNHELLNGAVEINLKALAVALRELADMKKTPESLELALEAEKNLYQHQAKIAAILKDAQEARAKAAIQQAPPHIYHG